MLRVVRWFIMTLKVSSSSQAHRHVVCADPRCSNVEHSCAPCVSCISVKTEM